MAEIEFRRRINETTVEPRVELPRAYYPDRTPLVRFVENYENIQSILLRPTSLATFYDAMLFVDALYDRGVPPLELGLPLVPGCRQDRLNDSGDMLFTLKSVAKAINACGFKKVRVLDPHSDVTAALITNCEVTHMDDIIAQAVSQKVIESTDYVGVIAGDGGAEKRAGKAARTLGLPLIHAWKRRDVTTGALTGFGIEPLPAPGKYLIVDDLCDGGGTFIGLADELERSGHTADLFVTHGLFTAGLEKLTNRFGKVICTDSVFRDAVPEGLSVVDMCRTW
jgi:ribose-phosphate pyrophosphokinase